MEKIRLSKLMSELGICSRREADSYIEKGWVLVDGEKVNELGTKVFPNQKVTLNKSAQNEQQTRVTILLNKPIGYVSGQAEDGHQPAVVLIKPDSRWATTQLRKNSLRCIYAASPRLAAWILTRKVC
jgi:23S rRNA pseudouridine2604 synthase